MMCKCSEVFENKFVQCFDQQEIAMYMKNNGTIKLVHGDIVEMTNINFCPYCGRNLRSTATRVEFKTGGRENGRRILNASMMLDYIDSLTEGEMYGIQKCSKGLTLLTKEVVIPKKTVNKVTDEEILILDRIAQNTTDYIERACAKGAIKIVKLVKEEILKEDQYGSRN